MPVYFGTGGSLFHRLWLFDRFSIMSIGTDADGRAGVCQLLHDAR